MVYTEVAHKILKPYTGQYAFYEVLKHLTTYDTLELRHLKP